MTCGFRRMPWPYLLRSRLLRDGQVLALHWRSILGREVNQDAGVLPCASPDACGPGALALRCERKTPGPMARPDSARWPAGHCENALTFSPVPKRMRGPGRLGAGGCYGVDRGLARSTVRHSSPACRFGDRLTDIRLTEGCGNQPAPLIPRVVASGGRAAEGDRGNLPHGFPRRYLGKIYRIKSLIVLRSAAPHLR